MKPLHLPLFVVGLLAPFLLTAQSLHLTGSTPSDLSANVALTTTVTFQFDQALQPGILSLDSLGSHYMVVPDDKIVLNGMIVAPDSRSVTFNVTHQPDVDYTWAFFGVKGAGGEVMTDFNLVRYTTAASLSPFSVQGRLILEDAPPVPDYSRTIVMLMENLSFMNEEGSDGPQHEMQYAVIANPTTGEFRFPGVKPGTYYVLAMKFPSMSDDMEPELVGILTDNAEEPIPMVVTSESITDLTIWMRADVATGEPVDATEAFATADMFMFELNPQAEPIMLEGRSWFTPPSGATNEWMLIYYSEADSMVTEVRTDGRRILDSRTYPFMSIPADERPNVDLATIKSIPDLFVPSQTAFNIAIQNGLGQDMSLHPGMNNESMEFRFSLSHFYFEHPDLVSVASNPYWDIRYAAHIEQGMIEFIYLIDAQNGAFLGRKERTETWQPSTFELMSTAPASMSANVPLQTRIEFNFSEPIQIETLSMSSMMHTWVVIPDDRITIQNVSYTNDYRTVWMDVTHTADTDYTWAFHAVRSADGGVLNTAEILNYTTKTDVSPVVFAGSLIWPDMPVPPHPSQAIALIVLLDSPDYFLNGMDGAPTGIKAIGATDTESWHYTVENVRPGTYFPAAFVFEKGMGGDQLIAYGYLPDQNNHPRSVAINDLSFTNVNFPLWYVENSQHPDPVDAHDAFAFADAFMTREHPDANPIVMEARLSVQEEGRHPYEWMVAYFSDVDSMITMVTTNATEIRSIERFHYMSMTPEERLPVELSTIKPIPDGFLASQSAYGTATTYGLGADIDRFLMLGGETWLELDYTLSHFYFEYPDLLTEASNPFWEIRFTAHSQTGMFGSNYLIDAVTGQFLHRKEYYNTWEQTGFELIESTPAHMSANVPLQTTLRFTFNEAIRPETLSFESNRLTWSVIPSDKITIQSISYTDYNRTVVMDVTHVPNTDYVWSFQGVISQDGKSLKTAEFVNYTTAPAASPLTLGGMLMWPDPQNSPNTDDYMAVVVLLDSPDYFLNGMNGPPPGILNAGGTFPGSWNYTIDNVRPGVYTPGVFVFTKNQMDTELLAYGYLPGENGVPLSITVTGESVGGLHLPMRFVETGGHHDRIDVTDVVGQARTRAASHGTGAELIILFGREEIRRPDMPDGRSYDWSFIFYESATDTIMMMDAHSDGIFATERFHLSSIPEEERIPKELVQPLPSGFISSGQAMSTARNNGLNELIQSSPQNAWMQVRYDLSRFYFRHPGVLTADSPPFWELQFNAELWEMDQITWSREAIFLVNAIDGSFIHKSVTTDLEDDDRAVGFELDQNVPNPFNPSTVIRFTLDAGRQTRLAVYDILGREVAVLVDGVMPAGSHQVTFNGAMLPSGVYLYRLESGGKTLQRKFTLLK